MSIGVRLPAALCLSLAAALATGTAHAVPSYARAMGGVPCSTCHTAYRERLEDGTYRVRTGPPSR